MSDERKFGRVLPHDTPLIARLWHRSIHADNGCFVWEGRLNQSGYGEITVDGAKTRVHRAAYELLVGPIPDGMQIDHLCRNRACWNPLHLEPVTSVENTMRSPIAPAAVNAKKTHCLRGHLLAGDNLRIYLASDGQRRRGCETCQRERYRRKNARRLQGEAAS